MYNTRDTKVRGKMKEYGSAPLHELSDLQQGFFNALDKESKALYKFMIENIDCCQHEEFMKIVMDFHLRAHSDGVQAKVFRTNAKA